MRRLLNNKKGFAITATVTAVIFGVVVLASLIAGGVFFKSVKDSISSGLSFSNPFLWIIGILVLIILIRRRRRY